MSMKQNAIGIPVTIRITRLPNMIRSVEAHSNAFHLLV